MIVLVCAPVFVFPTLAYTLGTGSYRALLPGEPLPEITTMAIRAGDFLYGHWFWVIGAVAAVLAGPTIAVRVARMNLPLERQDRVLDAVSRQTGGSAAEFLLQPVSFRLLVWYVLVVFGGMCALHALSRPPFTW